MEREKATADRQTSLLTTFIIAPWTLSEEVFRLLPSFLPSLFKAILTFPLRDLLDHYSFASSSLLSSLSGPWSWVSVRTLRLPYRSIPSVDRDRWIWRDGVKEWGR